MFENLSLKARLWLLGLVSAAGIGILAVSSIWHAYHSKAVLLTFVDEKIAMSRSATASYAHGLQMGQALRNILLDPANRKAYDNFAAARKSFGEELAKLQPLMVRIEGGKESAARLNSTIEQWQPLQNQIIELVNAGKNAEAMSLLVAKETPAWRAVKEELLGVVKRSETDAASSRVELVSTLDNTRTLAIVLGLASFVLVTAIAVFVASGIFKQVGGEPADAAASLHRIANGDLTRQIAVQPGDTTSLMAAMSNMQAQIHQLIGRTVASAESVVQESEGILGDAANLSKSAQDQSTAATAIASAVEGLTASISVMSDNAGEVGKLSAVSEKQAADGLSVVSATAATIKKVADGMADASTTMSELDQKVDDINGIVRSIREIADQTNLLALNAAIEAARAGEQGRGFAVVADEVRKLAELTTRSTQEIADIVGGIRQTTDTAVEALSRVRMLAQDSAVQTDNVSQAVKQMDQSSLEVSKAVEYIVNALREQTRASNDIAQRIEMIAQGIAQTNTASSQTSQRSGALVDLSHSLKESVRHFRV